MQFITAALMTASVVFAHPLYTRQDSGYPSPGRAGPTPRRAWLAKLNEAKAAGLIPNFAPSIATGSTPYYAAGTDTGPNGVCSWTISHCVNTGDLYDILNAPRGMFGVTFDDGPTPASSALIDFLQEQDQKSTHFVIGGNIVNNEAQFMQMVNADAHIGVHTWSHPYLTTLTDEQIVGELGWTSQIIFDKSGFVPKWVRAPYGDVDNRVRAIAREVFGLEHFVSWREDSSDWCLSAGGGSSCAPGNGPQSGSDLDSFFDRILRDSKENGLILLEHEQNSQQVAAFRRNYHKISQQGWDARAIPDLWGEPWYLNAAAATSEPDPNIEIGSGPVDASVQSSSARPSSTTVSSRTASSGSGSASITSATASNPIRSSAVSSAPTSGSALLTSTISSSASAALPSLSSANDNPKSSATSIAVTSGFSLALLSALVALTT